LTADAVDVLYDGEQIYQFKGERFQTKNTHGTGCTLSSAIAAKLAVGCTLQESVQQAKKICGKLYASWFGAWTWKWSALS